MPVPWPSLVEGISEQCGLTDLSCGGALIERSGGPPPRSPHLMQIRAPGFAPLQLHARVVRRDGNLHAVRFVNMGQLDRLELAERIDVLTRLAGMTVPQSSHASVGQLSAAHTHRGVDGSANDDPVIEIEATMLDVRDVLPLTG